jgi:hypothetical protein
VPTYPRGVVGETGEIPRPLIVGTTRIHIIQPPPSQPPPDQPSNSPSRAVSLCAQGIPFVV